MKSIRIDFIKDKRWRWVWAAAALSGLCVTGLAAWHWEQAHKAGRDVESRISIARQQVAQLSAPRVVIVDPRQTSAEQAAQLLQQDLNKVFASAENLKEFGVRLRNLNLDGPGGVLRLEFELDSLPRASSVTAVLNEGYENRPWQLESVTGATGNNPTGVASAQTLRGLWLVQLNKL